MTITKSFDSLKIENGRTSGVSSLKRKLNRLALGLALLFSMSAQNASATASLCDATAGNLIRNCGFELGAIARADLGFTTQYASGGEGGMVIVSNAHDYYSGWSKAPNSGNFEMVVNAATTANVKLWEESQITVLPNTTYYFSAFGSSLSSPSPAALSFSANGVQMGNLFTLTSNTGIWQEFTTSWYSGSNTTVDLTLIDRNTTAGGNDFALDDFIFVAVPEPSMILLMLSGFSALLYLKRRQQHRHN